MSATDFLFLMSLTTNALLIWALWRTRQDALYYFARWLEEQREHSRTKRFSQPRDPRTGRLIAKKWRI